MSMLAAPRRKQRIPVDPQNLGWSTDDNQVAKRMMDRMGWRGGGLGRDESGRRENIRLRANHAQKGLGSEHGTKADGHWVAHHDDFARLLADLNEKKKEKPEETEGNASSNAQVSIEERSRSSRKRIHYHRFVRSKDGFNSMTAEEKSAAIFGKKKKGKQLADGHGKEKAEESHHEKQEAKTQKKKKGKSQIPAGTKSPQTEGEQNTKTSALTMDQYFAQKMADMARRRTAAVQEPKEEQLEETEELEVNKKKKQKKRKSNGDK